MTETAGSSSHLGEAVIPRGWLVPGVSVQAVLSAQPADVESVLTVEHLRLTGLEVTIERCWLRDDCWGNVRRIVSRGFIHRSGPTSLVIRADQRVQPRRTGVLLARIRASHSA